MTISLLQTTIINLGNKYNLKRFFFMAFTRFSTLLVSSRLFFSADNSNCTERSLMKVSKA